MKKLAIILVLWCTAVFQMNLLAAEDTKIKIMILGVYHFSNPGLDVHKGKSFDHLGDKAQVEIAQLNRKLIGFNPDKILTEFPITYQSKITTRYQQYTEGKLDLSQKANEVYQIGFKVASALKHKDIYTIDATGVWPYDAFLSAVEKFDLKDVSAELEMEEITFKEKDKVHASRTVLERIVNLNKPETIMDNHMFYIKTAARVVSHSPTHQLEPKLETINNIEHLLVPLDPDYMGAELVAEWYKRNLKILSNIYQKTDLATDKRLLLIIGAGHVRILQHLFEDSPYFEVVDTNSILTSSTSLASK